MIEDMLRKLAHRENSMRVVLRELAEIAAPIIVETGCIRNRDNWTGDGQSTLIWQEFVQEHGGRVYSVDIDPKAVMLAKTIVDYNFVTVSCADSIGFLWNFNRKIDLIYLDSFDFDADKPLDSAIHHLHELAAASKNLGDGSLVVVDDTALNPDGGGVFGKGMLIFPYMQKIGAQLIVSGPHQMAWRMNG